MSLGFVPAHGGSHPAPKPPPRPPRAPPTPPPQGSVACCSRCTTQSRALWFFFLLQSCLGLSALGYVGLRLKWDLTYGNAPGHTHPHIPEEDYLQDNNNVLSVFMVAFCFDICEPVVVLLMRSLRFPRWVCSAWSALCMLLEGAALGCLFVLVLLQYPPDLTHDDPIPAFAPPAAPPPHSPVFTDNDLIPLFVLTILLGILKMMSYMWQLPRQLLQCACRAPSTPVADDPKFTSSAR